MRKKQTFFQDFKFKILFIFLCLFVHECKCKDERSVLDSAVPFLRSFRQFISSLNSREPETSVNSRRLGRDSKSQNMFPDSELFPCDPNVGFRSDTVPKSVHKVRPGDIDLVGGIGDSLTAGYGLLANNLINVVLKEYRGRSFSMGGEETWKTVLSLPNILKEFNPDLFGYSLGTSFTIDRASQFNVAEGGAVSHNMPYMTKILIKRIKMDKRVKLKKHWKMITFMIGDNDFCCEMCYYPNMDEILENHRQDVLTVLRLLRDNLPRTIVNLIAPPDVKILTEFKNKPPICQITHSAACPCIVGLGFQKDRRKYLEIIKRWQRLDLEIANMAEFDKEDFTVIPHEFTTNLTFPRTADGEVDLTYLAQDCFHFSQKGNSQFAISIWKSLMLPFGKKQFDGGKPIKTISCPTKEHPYIFTRRNS